MRNNLRSAAAFAALLALTACGANEAAAPSAAAPANDVGGRASVSDTQAVQMSSAPPAGMAAPIVPGAAPSSPSAAGAKASPEALRPTLDQMIVYTGRLEMLVDEDKESAALDAVVDAAESLGGHLDGRTNTTVVVKVPSARFREGMTKLEALGEVVDRNVTAEDVTEEFHDAEVRLENLRATRARLQEFLNRAANVQDALTVEHELERVAEEMDVLEGKVAFMKDRATWSQITVAVQPRPKTVPIAKPEQVPPPPPPPPKLVELPVDWIDQIGIDRLLQLK
jgi:hypothetical protein